MREKIAIVLGSVYALTYLGVFYILKT